jgi:predicted alpha/beta superfamily hydrolase
MSALGQWGGSRGGIFGYDALKEMRYIFNEYAILGDKICC